MNFLQKSVEVVEEDSRGNEWQWSPFQFSISADRRDSNNEIGENMSSSHDLLIIIYRFVHDKHIANENEDIILLESHFSEYYITIAYLFLFSHCGLATILI